MTELQIPALPCTCATLRRASRALTQIYEEALRPTGLRSSQFTILQVLTLAGDVTQGQLGQILAMDSTTLTRTLAIMIREGWVTKRHGDDRREWRISMTSEGKALFKRALPLWEQIQSKLQRQLGNSRWEQLMALADTVTNVATTAPET
ncbi:MarR family winged helix-turn-helix transcriptional regulator [Edaphobacter bradus]|uniref:MarR family winged helix-turn-helix transcriptional regulator n=1 Tax=Edaphobacter bradus TaxID=2259016 RepID=UPI0021DF5E99|nr:MarR family winged helix-turn-helix transcriptional regulator [Edaphobacter bradus]